MPFVVGLTNRHCQYSTNCLQTGSECIYPTPEQSLPSNESFSSPASSSNAALASFGSQMARLEPPSPGSSNALNNYVGGSFDALPEPSKRLLRHCTPPIHDQLLLWLISWLVSQYTVWGQRPVVRELESSAYDNPTRSHRTEFGTDNSLEFKSPSRTRDTCTCASCFRLVSGHGSRAPSTRSGSHFCIIKQQPINSRENKSKIQN